MKNFPKIKIGLDMDGTYADLITSWFNHINDSFGTNLKKEDCDEYSILNVMTRKTRITNIKEAKNALSFLDWESLYVDILPEDGANELFSYLERNSKFISYEILTFAYSDYSEIYKRNWMKKHFPNISGKFNVEVKNGNILKSNKNHLDVDVFIDDNADHITNWTLNHQKNDSFFKVAILVDQPWNRNNISWDDETPIVRSTTKDLPVVIDNVVKELLEKKVKSRLCLY